MGKSTFSRELKTISFKGCEYTKMCGKPFIVKRTKSRIFCKSVPVKDADYKTILQLVENI